MRLDRNVNPNGQGKYALLKLRRLSDDIFRCTDPMHPVFQAMEVLSEYGVMDSGIYPHSEFFVIRLKDKYAQAALRAYADAARGDDPEYASEIMEMAERSGPSSKYCRVPD